MLMSLIAVAVLHQAPTPEATSAQTAAVVKTNEERTAEALEKAAQAAERLAQAAERMSPPPPPAAAPAAPSNWSVVVGANSTWITGNVLSLTFAGQASAIRKTDRTIFAAKLFGGYGERYVEATDTTPASTDVLLYNVGGSAQFDVRFGEYVSAFVGAGLDTDHVKSVELRGYGDVGVGVLWLDRKEGSLQRLYLKTDLSLRVQPESRFQYYPTLAQVDDAFLIGPRLAASFRYAFTSATFITEDVEVLPNVLGTARVLVNSATKLGVGLVGNVSVTAGFALRYDSSPAQVPVKRKPLDTQLLLGIEASF